MSSQNLTPTDSGKELVQTGKNKRLNRYVVPDFQYSTIGRFIIYRLIHNRDVKIIISSKGSTTGTGKTTLAVILANWINDIGNDIFDRNKTWIAEDNSFMNVWEYLESYRDSVEGEVLLTDELEYLTDKRKSMTHENVKFTQAWQILRYKNVVTIGTAPSLWDMDKRILEHTDLWINVLHRGRANTYYLTVDDFTALPIQKRLRQMGYRESIKWNDVSDNPKYKDDLEFLRQEKRDIGIPGIDDMNNITEGDLKEQKRNVKKEICINLLKEKERGRLTLTQAEIGDMVGYSQQNVYKIKRDNKKEIENYD